MLEPSAGAGWHGSHVTEATDPPGPALPRAAMAVASTTTYLDTAHMTPLPAPVAAAMAADAEAAGRLGSRGQAARAEREEGVRAAAARLMGTDADDVAFVASTTQGVGLVAAGLDWAPGDRVLVAAGDHPSIVLPWRARADAGVEVVEVPVGPGAALDLDDVAAALEAGGGRIRVVAVSWVRADRGWCTDLAALAALAHDHGAVLCADLIQGLGARPCALAAWGVDAAAAGAQKWVLGPHGVGVAHLAPALRERLRVLAPSPHELEGAPGPLPDASTARRHESGTPNHSGQAGLGAALAMLETAGIGAVAATVDALAGRLADGLAAAGAEVLTVRTPGGGSGIVAARVPGVDADAAVARLDRQGVVVAARDGAVRFSAHAWNDATDVDAALAAVAAL